MVQVLFACTGFRKNNVHPASGTVETIGLSIDSITTSSELTYDITALIFFYSLCCILFLSVIIRCDVESIPNGVLSESQIGVGSQVTYTCDDGYELNGTSTRTCQDNGSLSGTMASCERKDTTVMSFVKLWIFKFDTVMLFLLCLDVVSICNHFCQYYLPT